MDGASKVRSALPGVHGNNASRPDTRINQSSYLYELMEKCKGCGRTEKRMSADCFCAACAHLAWKYRDDLKYSIACDTCGAEIGDRCQADSGRPATTPHAFRRNKVKKMAERMVIERKRFIACPHCDGLGYLDADGDNDNE